MESVLFKNGVTSSSKILKYTSLELLFSIVSLLFFVTPWIISNFGEEHSIDQIIINISNKTSVTDLSTLNHLKKSFAKDVIIPSLLLNAFFFFFFFIDRIAQISFLKKCFDSCKWLYASLLFIKQHILAIAVTLFIYVTYQIFNTISGFDFLLTFFPSYNHYSETFYAKTPQISFPDQKRNLIFIVLESMEATYQEQDVFSKNLIPKLTELQKNNINITNHPQVIGTHYTMGALVSLFCGQPPPSFGGRRTKFLHQKLCLSDILSKNNYNLFFIKGANAHFAGFDGFAREHSLKKKFAGLEEIKRIDPDWKKFDTHIGLGISDKRLYQLSKMKLNELSKESTPFAFMLLTLDTHFPKGFLDPSCHTEFNDYRDIVMCADTQVGNFIRWIQNQKFAKNTTIVIVSDHLLTDGDSYTHLSKINKKQRNNYNVIVNPVKNIETKNQIISHVDFLPTVIEALGGEIEGGRIALGTSIFSDKQTLIEELGEKKMNSLLFYYCAKGTSNIKSKIRALSGDVEQ